MTVDNDISYANFEYLMNLIAFIKSESLTNHMDEFYKWSNALLDVSPKNKWEELSREWNKATRVNYDRLASDGLIYNSNIEVGENSIWMGDDEYKWKQEFPTFSIHASFTIQISRILQNKIKSANSTISKENSIMFIESMHKWMMHQGFEYYVKDNGAQVYDFLKRKLEWDIHVISYNNGGYYNWHKDISMSTLFTFNLILNKGNTLKGGDLLFYDREIIEIENKNNFLVVFPSYIPHAIKPLYTEDNKDVPFLEQRFSIQFWVRFNKC